MYPRADIPGPEKLVYAAIGDSWAAGLPSGPIRPRGYSSESDCKQSDSSYPVQFVSKQKIKASNFHFLACNDADDHITDISLHQTTLIPENANIVSISVGLGFIGFGNVVNACDAQPDYEQCKEKIDSARDYLYNDPGNHKGNLLDATKYLVSKVHDSAPNARIVFLGFPRWLGSPSKKCHGPNTGAIIGQKWNLVTGDQRDDVNKLALEVNGILEQVANQTNSERLSVSFINPDDSWNNHRYCDEGRQGSWFIELDAVDRHNAYSSGYYHPNLQGQRALEDLLTGWFAEMHPGVGPFGGGGAGPGRGSVFGTSF